MATVTFNPSDKSTGIDLTNGNLTATSNTTGWRGVRANHSKSSSKWYWEITVGTLSNQSNGIATSGVNLDPAGNFNDATTDTVYIYNSDGTKSKGGASGATYAAGAVIGVALNLITGKIWFAKNNTWQASGDPVAGTNEAYTVVAGTFYSLFGSGTATEAVTADFGATAFTYTPPTGYLAYDRTDGAAFLFKMI
jgi:hypothetical protein